MELGCTVVAFAPVPQRVLRSESGSRMSAMQSSGCSHLKVTQAMPKERTPLEAAAGKLISAIQKEWLERSGELGSDVSEEVMHTSHELLSAAKAGSLESLSASSITKLLGPAWVQDHPRALPFIEATAALAFAARQAPNPSFKRTCLRQAA